MKTCIIFGAGPVIPDKIDIPDNDRLIIAADGGMNTLEQLHIVPDMIIGDLDSLEKSPDSGNFTLLPHVKDTTDMYEAVQIGLAEDCDDFRIYGGTGGRLDHTLANIQLAAQLSQNGKSVRIFDRSYILTAVTNGSISLPARESGYVSVFALSDECSGITIRGLFYEAENIVLKNNFALGVSNEFIGKQAHISVGKGTICVYYEI